MLPINSCRQRSPAFSFKSSDTASSPADDTIFEETVFDYEILQTRIREIAFLTRGLRITLRDKREGHEVEKSFHYEGGIKEFVQYLNKSKSALYPGAGRYDGQ